MYERCGDCDQQETCGIARTHNSLYCKKFYPSSEFMRRRKLHPHEIDRLFMDNVRSKITPDDYCSDAEKGVDLDKIKINVFPQEEVKNI